jgi:antitoxin VapB
MNMPIPTEHLLPPAKTTTVFTSGNSQAVRLPKEFRFTSKLVLIERRGDEIVLRERPLMVSDIIHQLPFFDHLPDDIEDQMPSEALSMEGIQ